ncbi:APC family permease [Akkermansiaceae bacterium]|nr:APC family permease [Akkermansiaceae bacterium]
MAKKEHTKLGELASTAICGNDISSSCLYVSALAIVYAGAWAPVTLLCVGVVLFLFRSIYAEVVGALPLNGGVYNALLNTTTKFKASVAAFLTILSYMATAVISASEAAHYAHHLFEGIPVVAITIGLLIFFTILTITGISESSGVAIVIFCIHIITLLILLAFGGFYLFEHGLTTLMGNFGTPPPGGILMAIFFGFSASMLGISGFESSANFVEEQKKGVFPKTLRNMWLVVTFFNPAIALLALSLVPIAKVPDHQEALLAHMGMEAGGQWLSTLISIDATLVLSGAVLTSFVGVNGLARRMTLDRCLPQFLLKSNRRGTTHRILIIFLLLNVSVYFITGGDLKALAGVYTLSFLSVMVLFVVGNILLKLKRGSIPRPIKARPLALAIALTAVFIALAGNAILNPYYLIVFLQYFAPALLLAIVMQTRTHILKALYFLVNKIAISLIKPLMRTKDWVRNKLEVINSQQIVFFTRGDNIANLNEVMLYVRKNEQTNKVKMVHMLGNQDKLPERLAEDIKCLDSAYPDIDVEFMQVEGEFSPETIASLSKKWGIAPNFMFIGCPTDSMPYSLADFGGVRVIM